MKVRVKNGKKGFIYGVLRRGDNPDRDPDEFTLKEFKHPKKVDENDEPLVVSIKQQFSKVWMEEVNPKKKAEKKQPNKKAVDK